MNLILIILIAANIVVSVKGFNDVAFFDKYKFSIKEIQNGAYYRLITSGFLHVDVLHLAFNMYGLYIFTALVLQFVDSGVFLLLYVVSMLGGNLMTYYQQSKNLYYTAVGASGAVSGVVFSGIILYPQMELFIFPLPIAIKAPVFGVLYIAYAVFGMKKQLGNIGHEAHLGGALVGAVLTLLFF